MINVRTDLAIEATKYYSEQNDKKADGIEVIEKEEDGNIVTIVRVLDEKGAENIGKPIGNYITMEIPEFTVYDGELMDDSSKVLGKTLKNFLKVNKDDKVLVVGLGNLKVTPDALGPKVAQKIMVTRHLEQVMPEVMEDSIVSTAAISPGVLGVTGIETFEIVKSVVDRIKPSLVVCIDALASRKTERVNRSIQICDTGIAPGAGVGNYRMVLNEENLGVKVIGIGVPTVVHASTIANDTIDLVLDDLISKSTKGKEFYNMLKTVDKETKSALIKEVLDPFLGEMIVTPKEVDLMVESLSKIIANGINIAVQPDMTMEDINKFLS